MHTSPSSHSPSHFERGREFLTLINLLRYRASQTAQVSAYKFLIDGETSELNLSHEGLDRSARAIAGLLQERGLAGERALLLFPPGLDFVAAFFGCVYAGTVAVPAYPPDPSRLTRSLARLQSVASDAQVAVILTDSQILSASRALLPKAPTLASLSWIDINAIATGTEESWREPPLNADDLAFLQYTSGSTGSPKGVMLTHANLLHNAALVKYAMSHGDEDKYISWLPTFHDMGFMAGVLQPLYAGVPVVLMSPLAFLEKPYRWLKAISDHQGTISGAPNFAYDLCVRKTSQEQKATLDLSSWLVAFNGAEQIRNETLERFSASFAEQGFRRRSLYPCYGLAEATLIVSGGDKDEPHIVKEFRTSALERDRAEEGFAHDDGSRALVSCGRNLPDQQIIAVNPKTLTVCSPGEVGEVWVRGPSVGKGYWNRPLETAQTFSSYLSGGSGAPFLRTGDLGFIEGGELFITGRLKDLIIIRGLNHYPQDIERTVESSHQALRPGCCAAFSIEAAGEERLVVVQEIDQHRDWNTGEITESITQAVADKHELQVYAVSLLKPGTIPKTSSGKIQRKACRTAFLNTTLEEVARSSLDELASSDGTQSLIKKALMALSPDMRQSLLESHLQQEMSKVLKVNPALLNLEKPLSTFGVDSLAAIELKNAFESSFDLDLPITIFLQDLSLKELAVRMLEQFRPAIPGATVEVRTSPPVQESPCSQGQKALWFINQMASDSAAYNIAIPIRIRGPLNIIALQGAFEKLLRRHRLRAVFVNSERGLIQRIQEHGEVPLKVIDAAGWSAAALNESLAQQSRRPFDLELGPVMGANIYVRSDLEHVLLLTAHHIALDLWSLVIIVDELRQLYQSEKYGSRAALPLLQYQYADFVEWQSSMLAGPQGETLWQYWQKQLAGELPLLNLPTDRPHPPAQTFGGSSHIFRLGEELSRKLNLLAKSEGATMYMVLVAGFLTLLHRYTGQEDLLLGSPASGRTLSEFAETVGYFINPVVLRTNPAAGKTFRRFLYEVRQVVLEALNHQDYPFPLLVERLQPNRNSSRPPLFQSMFILEKPQRLEEEGVAAFVLGDEGKGMRMSDVVLEPIALDQTAAQFELTLMMVQSNGSFSGSLQYNTDLFDRETIERMAAHLQQLLESIVSNPDHRLAELPMLARDERTRLLKEWNDTSADYLKQLCIHHLFETAAGKAPGDIAAVFDAEQMTYAQLNCKANQLARHLRRMGAGPERLVGIYVERSLDMLVALLAVMKAGAAYLPMDPAYPADRLAFMLKDAAVKIVLSQIAILGDLAGLNLKIVSIDGDWEEIAKEDEANLKIDANGENLAYVIYTSGSTGKPKGVMISHANVVNFFSGMDRVVGADDRGTWLAVTSISFDISALELLWTLARGFKVVIQPEQPGSRFDFAAPDETGERQMEFSLFYFASEERATAKEKYRLLLEGAKFADRHGFSAVWTPERHFHAFGGLYPNPSITSAAIAAITDNVKIRAGSIVMPLHNPVQIAEDWAVIDNLSGGRAAVSFASGWHADDFVFSPDQYANRKQVMLEGIETVQKLWRGEPIALRGGAGNLVEVAIHPRPIQPELPIWITAAGSLETFQLAGEMGANLLTHLLGQNIEELEEKISVYRKSYKQNHSGRGHVTLMLHAFIGSDMDVVRETVREPFRNYLATSLGLMSNLARSLGMDLQAGGPDEADTEHILSYAFDRYFETSGLFGTPKSCLEIVDKLRAIGCDEIACLIDFGVEYDGVINSLRYLNELKERSNRRAVSRQTLSVPTQIEAHRVSHMQCTPSMAAMLLSEPRAAGAFGSLRKLLIGGEAFPPALAQRLGQVVQGRMHNMYGPTETTVWSTTCRVNGSASSVPIGRPIANTEIYILDEFFHVKATGVIGELFIGGDGVARGYLNRPDVTAEKFTPNPFSGVAGARLYRTGDLARYLPDGNIDFLGRADDQTKIRGYRIEPGEIEILLSRHESIRQSVVVARPETGGGHRLVAYIVWQKDQAAAETELRKYLRRKLPEYMVPSVFVPLDEIPLTPNGKIDRRALPDPGSRRMEKDIEFLAPRTLIEEELAAIWKETLALDRIGVLDDFFNAGGHSIIATQLVSRIRQAFAIEIPLKSFFVSPNIEGLARLVEEAILARTPSESIDEMLDLLEGVED